MNPEQAPAPNTGQYDFIVNPQKPTKPTLNLLGGPGGGKNAFFIKIGVIVGGALILMMILAVVINMFFGGRTNTDDLVSLTQVQTEVVRVSAMGSKASEQALKNTAQSIQQTVASQRQGWLSYLETKGRKVKDKELALKKDTNTDKQLSLAAESNTYDTAFRQALKQDLEAYAAALKTAHQNASDAAERGYLAEDYDNVQILLKQLQ